ncbi:MAG: alpha/beta fold hydrolase [Acidobacteria bacterium]|nr:alpha/beta fold hydrolase [Acidobacteriota bacterium]
MTMDVLFIHGGGDDGYGADKPLAESLRHHLGADYKVHFPKMPSEELPDFGWLDKIGKEMDALAGPIVLVGHSLGASMLLRYLSERAVSRPIRGLFLLATPFWSGDEDWKSGLKLRKDFARTLPKDVPIFLYQNEDDEEVDQAQFAVYRKELPQATVRVSPTGGHQFNDDLEVVARDIAGV